MKKITLPMWQSGSKLLLDALLQKFNFPHDLRWTLTEISAQGISPLGGSMLDFERRVREAGQGMDLTPSELDKLSVGLADLDDISLEGRQGGDLIVEINCRDSSYWDIQYCQDKVTGPKSSVFE